MSTKDKTPLTEIGDVLDQIKEVEKMVKAQALIKVLTSLKEYAREVLVLKEKTTALLAELGISETDSKRVIDFINNSPEVQLTETDKKDIQGKARETVKDKKKTSQEELEKRLASFYAGVGAGNNQVNVPFIGYSQVLPRPTSGGYYNVSANGLNTALVGTSVTTASFGNGSLTLNSGTEEIELSI